MKEGFCLNRDSIEKVINNMLSDGYTHFSTATVTPDLTSEIAVEFLDIITRKSFKTHFETRCNNLVEYHGEFYSGTLPTGQRYFPVFCIMASKNAPHEYANNSFKKIIEDAPQGDLKSIIDIRYDFFKGRIIPQNELNYADWDILKVSEIKLYIGNQIKELSKEYETQVIKKEDIPKIKATPKKHKSTRIHPPFRNSRN